MQSLQSTRLALLTLIVLGASSCQTTEQSAGIRMVDELMSRVEEVEIEAELTHQSVYATLRSVHPLVAPGFNGDAAVAYAEFVTTLEAGELQGEALRARIEPMKDAAVRVFAQWESNLALFSGEVMRSRSEKRLNETRARYEAVLSSAESAIAQMDTFTAGVRDLALFLGVDLNTSSVGDIQDEARSLALAGNALRTELESCIAAAQLYVQTAAPLGQVEVAVSESRQVAAPAR